MYSRMESANIDTISHIELVYHSSMLGAFWNDNSHALSMKVESKKKKKKPFYILIIFYRVDANLTLLSFCCTFSFTGVNF